MHRFFTEDIREGTARVTGEDVRHIRRVLRMRPGDAAEICDGRGTEYTGVIASVSDDAVLFALSDERASRGEPGIGLTLYQALAKGAKFETVVQKAVELGVTAVVPVRTARCVAEPKRDFDGKRLRWQRIAEEAAKQSRRGIIPRIGELASVEDLDPSAYDLFAVAYEEERETGLKEALRGRSIASAAVLIGPEGGFEPEEVRRLAARGAVSVSLGKSILRTETAGLKAVANILYEVCE